MFVEEIGGCVVDLLEMVCFGVKYDVDVIVVVGVCFMGEIVKIFMLNKIVVMLIFVVICLLDVGCLIEEFFVFCD